MLGNCHSGQSCSQNAVEQKTWKRMAVYKNFCVQSEFDSYRQTAYRKPNNDRNPGTEFPRITKDGIQDQDALTNQEADQLFSADK